VNEKQKDPNPEVFGAGSVLRGNYGLDREEGIQAPEKDSPKNNDLTETFEQRARDRIGGSIAFVTKTRKDADTLFWDGEET